MSEICNVVRTIKSKREYLTAQQYKTLKGQAIAGDTDGAIRGLEKMIAKRRTNDFLKGERE